MAPHSSTLAWKIPWMEEPGGLQSMGLLRVGHDWVTSLHFSLVCIGEGNGNPLQCSCLENPRDGGAWWAGVYGVAQSRTRLKWLSSSSSSDIFANFLKMDCVLLILLVSFWWGRPWFSFYTKKIFKFFFFQLTFESFHFWTPHLPSTSELSSFYLSTKIALLSNDWFLTVSFLFSIYPAITVLISIFWLFVLSLILSPLYDHSDYS